MSTFNSEENLKCIRLTDQICEELNNIAKRTGISARLLAEMVIGAAAKEVNAADYYGKDKAV